MSTSVEVPVFNPERLEVEKKDAEEGKKGLTPGFLNAAWGMSSAMQKGRRSGSSSPRKGGTLNLGKGGLEALQEQMKTEENKEKNEQADHANNNDNAKDDNKEPEKSAEESDPPVSNLRMQRIAKQRSLNRWTPRYVKTDSTDSENQTSNQTEQVDHQTDNNTKENSASSSSNTELYSTVRIKNGSPGNAHRRIRFSDEPSSNEPSIPSLSKDDLNSVQEKLNKLKNQEEENRSAVAHPPVSTSSSNHLVALPVTSSRNDEEIKSLQVRLDQALQSRASLEKEVEELKRKLAAGASTNSQEIDSLRTSNSKLRHELDDVHVERNLLIERVKQLQSKATEQTMSLQERDSELQKRLEKEVAARKTLSVYIKDLEDQISMMRRNDPSSKFRTTIYVQLFMWLILFAFVLWLFWKRPIFVDQGPWVLR